MGTVTKRHRTAFRTACSSSRRRRCLCSRFTRHGPADYNGCASAGLRL